jgi:hypothetical protein
MKSLVVMLSLVSFSAAAADVTKFSPIPSVVEKDGDTYTGILVSEEEFRKILQHKLDSKASELTCLVDRETCTQREQILKNQTKILEERILRRDSWFERNRGGIGLLTGLALGAGMSIAIVQAVYQK